MPTVGQYNEEMKEHAFNACNKYIGDNINNSILLLKGTMK